MAREDPRNSDNALLRERLSPRCGSIHLRGRYELGSHGSRDCGQMSTGHRIRTEADAIRFIKAVKFALRYNSTPSLPLASMYAAAGDQRRAIELTNALLARDEAVETNVIADRLVLVHRAVVPAVYALRIRFRAPQLSNNAEQAFNLIRDDGTATAGDIRRYLGVDGLK